MGQGENRGGAQLSGTAVVQEGLLVAWTQGSVWDRRGGRERLWAVVLNKLTLSPLFKKAVNRAGAVAQ